MGRLFNTVNTVVKNMGSGASLPDLESPALPISEV